MNVIFQEALDYLRGMWRRRLIGLAAAWVVAIARHKLVDLWRRQGRREQLHDPLDDVGEHLLVADEQDAGATRDLESLLRELPAAQQQAIVLTKIEGLSVAEAASRTGASESAIKVQVQE